MSDPALGRAKLTRAQRVSAIALLVVVAGAMGLNLTISRSLSKTTDDLALAGDTMSNLSNLGREVGFMSLAVERFPDPVQFDALTMRHALFSRQLDIARARVEEQGFAGDALEESEREASAFEALVVPLGEHPSTVVLRRAQAPLRQQLGVLELSVKRLSDAAESELLRQGRRSMSVRRDYQFALMGMAIFGAMVTVGLLASLRRRASKELTEAFERLLAEANERRIAEDGLRRSRARFRALVHNANDVITVVDAELRIDYQSPSVSGVLGRRAEDLVGLHFLDLVESMDRQTAATRLAESIARPGVPVRVELHLGHGSHYQLHEVTICSLLEDPDVAGVVLNYRDVTERVAFQRQLERMAYQDALTDLPNRAYLQDAIVRISREHQDVGVLFIDLDGFKVVNDSLGHQAGDLLLQAVAQRLSAGIRSDDLIARLGGDEFTVVVTGERVESVGSLAERLLASLSEPFLLGDQVTFIGASIGIATTRDGEHSPAALLRNADVAMYRAKAAGRNRHVVFTEALHDNAVKRLQLETDLRGAVEGGQLELHYQPVYSAASGRISSFEALLRWHRYPDKLSGPAEFIAVAEEVGLIGSMGRWALREACRQRVQWDVDGVCPAEVAISVNLSALQFTDVTLLPDVAGILAETGLPAHLLMLEVTETAIIGDIHASRAVLSELRRMGVRVALDDFGTGNSPLSHLSDLPIDAIKIDKSFVAAMCSRVQDALIVDAVISLAHALGVVTVAEGVETVEQMESLGGRGCDQLQGYLLARPIPAAQVPALFSAPPKRIPLPRRKDGVTTN